MQLKFLEEHDPDEIRPEPQRHIATVPPNATRPKKKEKKTLLMSVEQYKRWLTAKSGQLPLFEEEKKVISQDKAHQIMDATKETLDESIELQIYLDSLSPPQLVAEAQAFLERNEHNDKLFWRNGWGQLVDGESYHLSHILNPVRDKIFASRPDGQSTYRG